MDIIRRDTFTGSNNIAKPERLPEGAVVDAVNVDFTVGGKMELRTGFERVLEADNVRAVFAMGDDLALVAGDKLLRFSDGVTSELASMSPGPVAAVYHNGELLLNTLNQSVRVAGTQVLPWAVPSPAFDLQVEPGNLPAGVYRVAVTALGGGIESGCIEKVVTLGEGQALRVSVADDRECRLYCSVANGSTLYHQGIAYDTNLISSVMDAGVRCDTAGLEPLPFCSILASHQGMVVGADGRYLHHSRPMQPHLCNPEFDYVAYPEPITLLASVAGGVFVCADKTYFLSGMGGSEFVQRAVAEYGAVAGTAVTLPDGSAAWFCQYGQVIGRPDGSIELITRNSYSPDTAQQGSAGFIEHNGNQMVVTTMHGETRGSGLRAGDHWDLEIIENE